MAIPTVLVLVIAAAQLLGVQGSAPFEWISYNPALERVPANAIVGGRDSDGANIYISQMRVEKERIPSQLIPEKSNSYAVHNGDIYKSPITAVPTPILCGSNYAWVHASMGSFPKNAIACGKSESGDTLYVGRVNYNGSVILGAVGPTRNALFAAYNGVEVEWFGMYHVLIYSDVDQWTRATFDNFPKDAVVGGYDRLKHELYVGIIRVGNQVIPAQIDTMSMLATASYHGGIAESEDFQVLTGGTYQWELVKKGKIPANVLVAGRTQDGEALYVGRVVYKKLLIPGTIVASEKVLYISYLGKLRTVETGYEVLVRIKPTPAQ